MGKTFSTGLLTNGIFQDASNNIGIGAAPSGTYKLEVTGKLSVANTYALDPLIRLATTTSGNVEVQMRTATTTYNAGIGVVTSGYDFGLFTNNTSRLNIASTGEVLINDTSANAYAKLQVNATSGTAFALTNTSAAATDAGNIMFFWGTTDYNSMASIGSFWNAASNTNAYLQFKTRGSGVNTERMRITSSGNVGIGNSNDTYKLEVSANAATWATRIYNASATGSGLVVVTQNTTTSAGLALYNGTSYVLYARNDGNVGIGTTSPGEKLVVQGDNNNWTANIKGGATAGQSLGLLVTAGLNSSDYSFLVQKANSATIYFTVRGDGALLLPLQYSWDITGGTTRTMQIRSDGLVGYITSLRASKANITSIETSNWLNQLNPVNFNYRKRDEDNNYTNDLHSELEYGLIAEEVEAINSDMVFYDIKEDGSKELRGVSYEKLIIPILRLVQELSVQNQDLKSRLDKAGL